MRFGKLETLLQDLGCQPGEEISLLLITHPHCDHYGAARSLLGAWSVRSVALPPFWSAHGQGTAEY